MDSVETWQLVARDHLQWFGEGRSLYHRGPQVASRSTNISGLYVSERLVGILTSRTTCGKLLIMPKSVVAGEFLMGGSTSNMTSFHKWIILQ
jgi:hypothetical protein